jgi:hypothetical protein
MGCKVTIGAAGRSDAGSLWLYGGASCAAEQDTSSDMNDGPMLTTETSSPCKVRSHFPARRSLFLAILCIRTAACRAMTHPGGQVGPPDASAVRADAWFSRDLLAPCTNALWRFDLAARQWVQAPAARGPGPGPLCGGHALPTPSHADAATVLVCRLTCQECTATRCHNRFEVHGGTHPRPASGARGLA